MSEIISFRLSKNNPREARALELLYAKTSQGHSVRFIMTEALLMLESQSMGSEYQSLMRELRNDLRDVNELLIQIENERRQPLGTSAMDSDTMGLSDSLIAGIKNVAKPGLKIE